MKNDFSILVDGNLTTLTEFLEANTEGVDDIDLKAVRNLQPGQRHFIPCHCGYAEIKRPVPVTAEMTNYEEFQLNRYGNVLGSAEVTPEGDLYESGIEELNRLADYMNAHSERQLQEAE